MRVTGCRLRVRGDGSEVAGLRIIVVSLLITDNLLKELTEA